MKIKVLLASIAVLAVASCTKNNIDSSKADRQVIIFDSPVMAAATKGANEITTFPQTQSFVVFAHYYPYLYTSYADGMPYMDNVTVAFDPSLAKDGAWAPVPTNYYWPVQGTLTFAAYSPPIEDDDIIVTYDDSGFSFEGFTVNVDPAEQVDLLFSERTYNQESYSYNPDDDIPYEGVQINFLHALSSVRFEIKADKVLVDGTNANRYEFRVKNVTLKGVHNKGSFDQNLPIAGINQTTPAPTERDWKIDAGSQLTEFQVHSGEVIIDSEDSYNLAGTDDTNLILIPQSLDQVSIHIKYDMRHSGMAADEWVEDSTAEASLSTSKVSHWLRGKRYTYTLTLGLNEIKFAPKVETWITVPNFDL